MATILIVCHHFCLAFGAKMDAKQFHKILLFPGLKPRANNIWPLRCHALHWKLVFQSEHINVKTVTNLTREKISATRNGKLEQLRTKIRNPLAYPQRYMQMDGTMETKKTKYRMDSTEHGVITRYKIY